jgi:hypothetical protein
MLLPIAGVASSKEGLSMNTEGLDAPTVADEVSAVVDDAQVIARTLPAKAKSSPVVSLRAQLDCALGATRDFVNRQPMQALLITAAASAALTMLLVSRPRGGHA